MKDFTNIDVSIMSDSDKESEEDNAAFIGDEELLSLRVLQESYRPYPPEYMVIAGERSINAIASTDFEYSDKESCSKWITMLAEEFQVADSQEWL
jgi:hypothetical protein